MSSIRLHPTDGVSPRLTTCRRCGKDYGIALMGIYNWKSQCECGTWLYGFTSDKKCPKCRSFVRGSRVKVGDHEKLPIELCDECKQEIETHRKIVAEGGIYFKCSACGKSGVIRHTAPLCEEVRKKLGVKPGEPCGIEFDKCEQHTPVSETEKENHSA